MHELSPAWSWSTGRRAFDRDGRAEPAVGRRSGQSAGPAAAGLPRSSVDTCRGPNGGVGWAFLIGVSQVLLFPLASVGQCPLGLIPSLPPVSARRE